MTKWNDLKVRTKLLVLVATVALALAIVGAMGLKGMYGSNSSLEATSANTEHVATLGAMKSDFLTMRLDLVYMMSLKDDAKLKEKWDDYVKNTATVRNSLQHVMASNLDGDERKNIASFQEDFEKYVAAGTKLGEALLAAHASRNEKALTDAINFGATQVAPLYIKPAKVLADLVDSNILAGRELFKAESAAFKKSFIIMSIIITAAIIAAFSIGFFIARSIANPLETVFATLQAMAGGNLSVRCNITSRDEMGMLSDELNIMADTIHETIARVTQNGLEVASAASQMHSTAEEMATGAEQAAAQTQTIATASEEMSATSSDIANNCHMAASNASRVNEAAITSARIVDETISVMGQIARRVRDTASMVETLGNRSEEIGEIVSTIEDIADQTNLLALNAAIEAARAGEQGRGFAVVADEVRALAERTTKATKQIADTIKRIQAETRNAVASMEEGVCEVEKGTSDAAKSGEAIRSILEQIDNLSLQVNQIATAAEEQTATTGEITNNIQQITSAVQLTANGSHESAAAAAQLARLAEDLRSLMERFRLNTVQVAGKYS